MEKRTFLKTTSATVIGSLLVPLAACNNSNPQTQTNLTEETRKNWAGNLTYSTKQLYQPETVPALQEVVRKHKKVKAVGTRHCFNRIADSEFYHVSLQGLKQIALDENNNTVSIEAGVNYGELSHYLHEKGYALHNLASLPHISVVGACATATHGSGVKQANLASAVRQIEFVKADGELLSLSRDMEGDKFNGAVVNLGALGIVTRLTLDVLPTFQMRQDIYLELPVNQLEQHFEEVMSAGYSVSLFTDWQGDTVNQVWVKRKVENVPVGDADPEFFGARLADRDLHPIIEISAENCTQQMGVAGPWYERMPHFRMEFTPSSGKELQAEYFVPREQAMSAFRAIQKLKDEIAPLLMISEIRTIAADNFWMSPCYQQDSVAFHFTCKQDWQNLKELLPKIESVLQAYDVRPHWGKMFTLPAKRLRALYPKFTEFMKLKEEYDPEGKFSNTFLEERLFKT
ncbi:D-arabinono-1,4-lactone oxidase [Porifericola rhodea]|uniref:D-arabinono-1,4-lactone oxidase n=1 Tax=Porifericola rhodea TaxID=930972 RepID=UPI002665CDFF|nr:D-arabinono-1,4-lactone oxidase [Porifericola rhodea]WKN30150.1 D-arabinono-1,4-lactone oxidase [Porifericola rhodea]